MTHILLFSNPNFLAPSPSEKLAIQQVNCNFFSPKTVNYMYPFFLSKSQEGGDPKINQGGYRFKYYIEDLKFQYSSNFPSHEMYKKGD